MVFDTEMVAIFRRPYEESEYDANYEDALEYGWILSLAQHKYLNLPHLSRIQIFEPDQTLARLKAMHRAKVTGIHGRFSPHKFAYSFDAAALLRNQAVEWDYPDNVKEAFDEADIHLRVLYDVIHLQMTCERYHRVDVPCKCKVPKPDGTGLMGMGIQLSEEQERFISGE